MHTASPSAPTSGPTRREQLLGLFAVSHPIPSAMYVVAVGLLSWLAASAAHRSIAPVRLVLLLAGVACTQIATGAVNDIRDFELDSVSRPEKPLVRGLITPTQASVLAWATTAGVFLFLTPLGLVPLLLGVFIEALGLAYDFGLKGTPFSALLFACFFPLIPLLAWVVFGVAQSFLPWLIPVTAFLGVSMNVANSLPDLEDDLAHGVSGLPHVLGMRHSLTVAWGLPLATVALMWILNLSGAVPARAPGMMVATAAGVISVGVAVVLFGRRPSSATLRSTFLIQALGVAGVGVGWLAAVAV